MQCFQKDPRASLRVVTRRMNMCHSTVNSIITAENLRPFHLNPVQELHENDAGARVEFGQWFIDECHGDPTFINKLLVTDESPLTECGVRNSHNEHCYAELNPRVTRVRSHQTRMICGVEYLELDL